MAVYLSVAYALGFEREREKKNIHPLRYLYFSAVTLEQGCFVGGARVSYRLGVKDGGGI